ncbi:MAG: hypothetical protein KDD83_04835, partial [Caldilineaceae bacterium]|nr:hypothetical protein [Caldilineaceae bacterium]
MKRSWTILSILVIFAMVLAACTGAPAPAGESAPAAEAPAAEATAAPAEEAAAPSGDVITLEFWH